MNGKQAESGNADTDEIGTAATLHYFVVAVVVFKSCPSCPIEV